MRTPDSPARFLCEFGRFQARPCLEEREDYRFADIPSWGEGFEKLDTSCKAVPNNWKRRIVPLLEDFNSTLRMRWQEGPRIEGLERELILLKDRVATLECSTPTLVPIETLAPEPYEVLRPFLIVLRPYEEEHIATWFDANISASGETAEDALCNFKDILIATFECLTRHKPNQLGPSPACQLTVLQEFIRKTP